MPARIAVHHGETVIVEITGELVDITSKSTWDALAPVVRDHARVHVVLDGLLELDKIGLEVLLLSAELAHTRGNDLTWSGAPDPVAQVLADTSVIGVMRFAPPPVCR